MYDVSDISIVVLSHNRIDELKNNLFNLISLQNLSKCELIVVDNNSQDGSRNFLKEQASKYHNLKILLNPVNYGVAKGRNIGWGLTTRKLILNIDEDTRINLRVVELAVEHLNSDSSISILSPRIYDLETNRLLNNYGEHICDIGNFMGGFHILKREVYNSIGEFDLRCKFGGEELDYSIRAKARNFRIVYTPLISVFHNGKKSNGDNFLYRNNQWIYNHSRILAKYFPLKTAIIFTTRYLISTLIIFLKLKKLIYIFSIIKYCIKGFYEGVREFEAVDLNILKYYNNKSLLPDIGNKPLLQKIIKKKFRI
jgi:GT2 family glycosyltransferase